MAGVHLEHGHSILHPNVALLAERTLMSGSEVLASIGQMSIISRGFRLALLVACLATVTAAVHWRHRRWRFVGTALLALVLLGANVGDSVNVHYGYLPNLESLWGGYRGADQSTWSHVIAARYRQEVAMKSAATTTPAPSAAVQPHGSVVTASIPGPVSGFRARAAQVYLPPAWVSRPSLKLPVLVMLHGTPGSPVDWTRSAGADVVSDQWAARHGGVAPILVMPDINGRFWGDSECVDGPNGNVDTYLSVDVPNWIRSNLHPAQGPQRWAVGGLSEGGMCAMNVTLRHPQVYATFLNFSGDAHPTHRGGMETLFTGGHVARAAQVKAYDPMQLLTGYTHPKGVTGWFEVGTGDGPLLRAARDMHQLAQQRGIDTHLVEVPNGRHDFRMWRRSFQDAYRWVAPRLVEASNISGPPRPH